MAYDCSDWEQKLAAIADAGLYRERLTLTGPQSGSVSVSENAMHGKPSELSVRNFASNDYLGLANHPQVKQAAIDAIQNFGLGSGSSDVVCGHFEPHQLLEEQLAAFTGRDKALLFSSGFMANLAVADVFCDARSLVLQDKLNHASLIDGGRLSGARSQRYLHCSGESLDTHLEKFTSAKEFSQILIATDGVFSMDGDVAPLAELARIADKHSALLAVDDAHGLGVLGEGGRGSLNEAGLSQEDCPILIGTFGKAFGSFGAFVAGPKAIKDVFEQRARTHIYTTSLPPAIVAATSEALRLIESADEQRSHLKALISVFQRELGDHGFELLKSDTPIQGVIVGGNQSVMRVASFLREHSLLVGAIRPPTVAPGTARLRITLSASHSFDDVECLVAVLRRARDAGCFNE